MKVKTQIPGYIKDTETGVVINTDVNGYNLYKAHRSKLLSNKDLNAKVEKMENDIADIKKLLLQALNIG